MPLTQTQKRLLYLDLIKVVSLIFMPVAHMIEELADIEIYADSFPLSEVMTALGLAYITIGPVLFIFSMGVSMHLTRHTEPKDFAKRGVILIGCFFLLNIFRYVLPEIFKILCFNESDPLFSVVEVLFVSDVLLFAGLAFLFFALVKKLRVPASAVIGFGLICTIGQMFIPALTFGSSVPETILSDVVGYFIFVEEDVSFFPFISWIIFVILGYIYGEQLLKTASKDRFHLYIGISGVVVLLILFAVTIAAGIFETRFILWGTQGFRMDMFSTFFSAAVSAISISILYFAAKPVKGEKITRILKTVSGNITRIYCIHWVVLEFFLVILMECTDTVITAWWMPFVLGILLFVVSAVLAEIYTRWKINQKMKKKTGNQIEKQ
ncbi:MAG TPA: hypothetical protein O0X70_07670 [Methanocorpusculum sp.]|nr:hypothetical protein [Methanocorpusculum sp.]